MLQGTPTGSPNRAERPAAAQRLTWLEQRVRELEERLASCHPEATDPIGALLSGPQRSLPGPAIEQETHRLLGVLTEQGVGAVLAEVCTCRSLLLALAEACHAAGLTSAGQYLDYLTNPCA